MPNSLIVSVGRNIKEPGKFYWNIKSASHDLIYDRTHFDSLEEAKLDLEQFKQDLINSVVIENT